MFSTTSPRTTRLPTLPKVRFPCTTVLQVIMLTPVQPDQLNKTKVTGVDQVDNLQDGVNNLAAGQIGQGGLLQPVGDHLSKEGINRAERGGKDDSGSYAGAMGSSAQAGASKVTEGAKGAGSYVGSFFGGKKEEKK